MKPGKIQRLTIIACALTSGAALAQGTSDAEFDAMLAKYDAAQIEFHKGNAELTKALWSHTDDVTLSGGAGGPIEKGWQNVSHRLEWAAAQYTRGTQVNKRVSAAVNGNFAYAVQTEHITFYLPGSNVQSKRDYRVTSVFRKEAAGWRVVHRQADTMMTRETPK